MHFMGGLNMEDNLQKIPTDKTKELASWLMASIDDFAAYQDGKIGLFTFCKKIANEVIKFEQNQYRIKDDATGI